MAERRDEIRTREPDSAYTEEREVIYREPQRSDEYRSTRRPDETSFRGRYEDYDRSGTSKKTPAEIEREIERTRAEMSDTINQIEERISPTYLKDKFMREMKHTARDAGSSMWDLIRENPVPAIMTGVGFGWLVMKGKERSSHSRSYYSSGYGQGRYPEWGEYRGAGYRDVYYGEPRHYGGEYLYAEEPYYGRPSYRAEEFQTQESSTGEQDRDKVNEIKDQASDRMHQAGERISGTMHEARDRASHMMHGARDSMYQAGHEMQHQAYRAKNTIQHAMDESPLAVGAIAMGIGAAIGLMIPGTQREDELMGSTRDHFVDDVRSRAEHTFEKAKDVAGESMQRVKEDIKEETKSAANEIKNTAKEDAKSASRDVKNTAREETSPTRSTTGKPDEPRESPLGGGRSPQGSRSS